MVRSSSGAKQSRSGQSELDGRAISTAAVVDDGHRSKHRDILSDGVASTSASFRYSRLACKMRAFTAEFAGNGRSLKGIRTGQVENLTFALGSGIAKACRVALQPDLEFQPNLGQNFIPSTASWSRLRGSAACGATIVGALVWHPNNSRAGIRANPRKVVRELRSMHHYCLFQKRPRGLFRPQRRAARRLSGRRRNMDRIKTRLFALKSRKAGSRLYR